MTSQLWCRGRSYQAGLNDSKRTVWGVIPALHGNNLLNLLIFMAVSFTSTSSQSECGFAVYNWLTKQTVHGLPLLWTYSIASCSAWVTEFNHSCCVGVCLFVCLHFSHYTLTFSANVSFYNVHPGELIQEVFHLLFQAACLWKWASSMFYSMIQERWMWLQATMCYSLVFKKRWSAISYSCNIAPESCPRKEN